MLEKIVFTLFFFLKKAIQTDLKIHIKYHFESNPMETEGQAKDRKCFMFSNTFQVGSAHPDY